MTSTERKETLAFIHNIAMCASLAADRSDRSRDLDALRDIIAKQEREHRAMGRRMVGNIGARMSVDATCDYFVARTLATGIKARKVSDLSGLRADYVSGAILISDKRFATEFRVQLKVCFPKVSFSTLMARCEAADYCELVSE